VVVLDRTIVLALLPVGDAAIAVSVGVLRREPDHRVVVLDRAIVFALAPKRIATIVVGLGVFGIELERLIVILNGAVVVLLVAPFDPAIVIGDRPVARVELTGRNGAAAGRDGDIAGFLGADVRVVGNRRRRRQHHRGQPSRADP